MLSIRHSIHKSCSEASWSCAPSTTGPEETSRRLISEEPVGFGFTAVYGSWVSDLGFRVSGLGFRVCHR